MQIILMTEYKKIFIITGILGFTLSVISYNNKAIRDLNSMIEQ